MHPLLFLLLPTTLLTLATCQLLIPTLLQLSQGRNAYFPVDTYFHNYQNLTLSHMTSYDDQRSYRLCFVGQQRKPFLEIAGQFTIINNDLTNASVLPNNTPNQSDLHLLNLPQSHPVLHNLDHLINTNQILDTFFSHQTLYLITKTHLHILQFLNNSIASTKNATLPTPVSQAQFIQTQSALLILTDSHILSVSSNDSQIQLTPINSIDNQKQIYLNAFYHLDNIVYITDDAINVLPNQPSSQSNNIKKPFTEFEYDLDNAFFASSQPTDQNLLLVFDEQHAFVTFDIDLTSNSSLESGLFYRLSQGNKCTKAQSWANYLFLECRNHIVYLKVEQIMNCKNMKTQKVNECLQALKVNHLNIGYHIKAIEFSTLSNVDFLVVIGTNKYEVRYISVASQEEQPNDQSQANPDPRPLQILAIPALNTFYTDANIHKAYMLSMNTTVILSRSSLLIASQFPEKKEFFCKTVDENSQTLLDQPSGNYNGTLTVEGFCEDLVNKESLVQIFNGNMCRITTTMIVIVSTEAVTYAYWWWVLVSGIAVMLIGLGVYCVMKRRSLQQYKTFEGEKHHGAQVLQQTMVTEANHEETLGVN